MIKLIFIAAITWISPGPKVPADSLRLETINGKQFIIHMVDEKETLFGISRRYGVTITELLEYNKDADAGMDVGLILKVPYIASRKIQTPTGSVHKVQPKETLFSIARMYEVSVDDIKKWNNLVDNSISVGQGLIIKKAEPAVVVVNPTEIKTVKGYHTVAAKETLYSISSTYGVSVIDLKQWNNLATSELRIGQVLRIAKPEHIDTAVTTTTTTTTTETTPIVEQKLPVEQKETVVRISENVVGSDEVKESGLAELIEGTEGNRKYLALHRTAKVGAILKVRNELNNREVFVRVVGPLPATGVNDKIVIKISKSAFDRLGAIDLKFRAEVTYYK